MSSTHKPIRLIVGLGNPGPQYADTRHNAGAWYIEQLARQHNTTLQADKRFFGNLARIKIQGEDTWLLFPTTFMNRSGQAVNTLSQFFKIQPEEILVAHDELDLLPGQLKIKKGGGHAGHNGLKDIAAHIGNEFWRARIGIGHPRTLQLQQNVADFVLHRPSNDQEPGILNCIDVLLKHSSLLLKGNMTQAITNIHTECDTRKAPS
jgi:PTH1 family peptidyl-tRNA hydrolase